jgi:hypothetical protein
MSAQKFICGYCDKYFSEPGVAGCGSCSHSNGCKKVKCPYCGYDNPPISESLQWLEKIKRLFSKEKVQK